MKPLLALIVFLASLSGRADASSFTVNPIRVDLDGKVKSTTLTVKNEGTETLRAQVTSFAWSQSAGGDIQLAPTKNVVVFPTLLEVPPGQEKKIRVGVTEKPGDVEVTYRVFVEELPNMQKPQTTGEVRVMTKFGIPVFVAPTKIEKTARLDAAAFTGGNVEFTLNNTGSVSTLVKTVHVSALDAGKHPLIDEQQQGWYVLARSGRRFTISVPKDVCARIDELAISVELDHQPPATTKLARSANACAP